MMAIQVKLTEGEMVRMYADDKAQQAAQHVLELILNNSDQPTLKISVFTKRADRLVYIGKAPKYNFSMKKP